MNPPHLHLRLNQLPVLGPNFGLALLLYGVLSKSNKLSKTALGVFVIIALLAVPAYLTGEPVEDGVDAIPGVAKPITEQHEEFAAAASTGVIVLGAASLIVSGLMGWTANPGGQIRHTEIRSNTSATHATDSDDHR